MLSQECVSDRLEGQRQEQAIHLYFTQTEELDRWLTAARVTTESILEAKPSEEAETESQLSDCQVRAPPVDHRK